MPEHDHDKLFPELTRELTDQKRRLAPGPMDAFREFGRAVYAEGAIPARTKQLIALAAAHVTQCPYCIRHHAREATRIGVTPQEMMEAIWIAAEMRAGAASAHAALALDEIGLASAEKAGHR